MNFQLIIHTCYFAAAFLFIHGLKRMSSPVTARSGIVVAGYGMLIATLASFLYVFDVGAEAEPRLTVNIVLAVIALVAFCSFALCIGRLVAITAMPQMVAL